MEPLIVLIVVTTLVAGVGAGGVSALAGWTVPLRAGLSAMFVFTAVAHFDAFGKRDELVAMVPPVLPEPEMLVTATGVLEVVGAVGLLLSRTWPWSAALLSLLLLAMFPANVYKALEDPHLTTTQELVPRTGIQIIFLSAALALVVSATKSRRLRLGRGHLN